MYPTEIYVLKKYILEKLLILLMIKMECSNKFIFDLLFIIKNRKFINLN